MRNLISIAIILCFWASPVIRAKPLKTGENQIFSIKIIYTINRAAVTTFDIASSLRFLSVYRKQYPQDPLFFYLPQYSDVLTSIPSLLSPAGLDIDKKQMFPFVAKDLVLLQAIQQGITAIEPAVLTKKYQTFVAFFKNEQRYRQWQTTNFLTTEMIKSFLKEIIIFHKFVKLKLKNLSGKQSIEDFATFIQNTLQKELVIYR